MNLSKLKKHPSKEPYHPNKGYPIGWSYILGEIFHPLCLNIMIEFYKINH